MKERKNTLQSIIDYFEENGVSSFNVNILIHTNLPALGGNKNIIDCIRENNWDEAWAVSEAYIAGDYF